MCRDSSNSSRLATGGTIAVLRSPHDATGSPVANEPVASCDLLFENHPNLPDSRSDSSSIVSSHVTRAVFRTRQGVSIDGLRDCCMLIHRDGDLRTQAPMSDELRSALYAIELKPMVDEHQNHARMDLSEAMELCVGTERGVIGRRVTIVRGGERVAEGIIGYN